MSRLDYNERGGRVAVKHSASFAVAARRNSHEMKSQGGRQIERQSSEFSGRFTGYGLRAMENEKAYHRETLGAFSNRMWSAG